MFDVLMYRKKNKNEKKIKMKSTKQTIFTYHYLISILHLLA